MTAAEILRNALPQADENPLEQAIAELDRKIGKWSQSLKGQRTEVRGVVAPRPAAKVSASRMEPSARSERFSMADAMQKAPGAALTALTPSSSYSGTWDSVSEVQPEAASWRPVMLDAAPAEFSAAESNETAHEEWAAPAPDGLSVAWPTADDAVANWAAEPSASHARSSASHGSLPAWAADAAEAFAAPSPKVERSLPKALVESAAARLSVEERERRAAAEEARFDLLDVEVARKVRLLRRMDPVSTLEALIAKAAEDAAVVKAVEGSRSWWRRR